MRTISTFFTNPCWEHWLLLRGSLYASTSSVTLCFGGSKFNVRCYIDLYFAIDLDNWRSIIDHILTCVGEHV